jgi:asparagine synthase (glutamine-hydrolysing)
MCGISGLFNTGGDVSPDDQALVCRMTNVLAHRGPDDSGVHANGPVALGHRRLSVIDLSANGHQPMSNEDGTVWITYNGEVYNFAELKSRHNLEAKGHRFRSKTDTEVLIHLYEELGIGMMSELDGMFAFALWDARTQELHLCRDRYGIKPLFYAWTGATFLFGSEIKSILEDPRISRRINPQALHDFLTYDYVPGAQTAFAEVSELPVAHVLTISRRGHNLRRYWTPKFEPDESLSEPRAIKLAGEYLEKAVEKQLVADVPVGVLLSGGMDSSTLAALMSRRQSAPVHTYSIGFEDESFNELPFARMVAEKLGTVHREFTVKPDLVRAMLPAYLRYIDEPYADGSAIPTYYVCQIAKGEVVVVLSGEGGDEIFAGYETYAAYRATTLGRRIPRWIRNGLVAPIVRQLPVSDKKLSFEFKAKRFLGGLDLPPDRAHLWWRIVLSESEKLGLYSRRFREQLNAQPSDRHFVEVFGRSTAKDVLNRLMEIDTSVFLPDDLMIKNDRMSMAHSLEARVPMTDNELVAYMATVPPTMKLKGMSKKYLMRSAMRGILPDAVIDKKKVGLEMPYSRWLKAELKDLLLRYCGPENISATGIFEPSAVKALIDQHSAGQRDWGRALWGLLNYMMWLEMYQATVAF